MTAIFIVLAGGLGLVGGLGYRAHARHHAEAVAQQEAAHAAAIYERMDEAKKTAAFDFAAHSPEFKTALNQATCPLGQKPLSGGYAYEHPHAVTSLNEKGQGRLVVAYNAEHDVAAVVTCGGG